MTLRPFRLPADLKTLVEIIPPAFQYPENDAWSMQPEEVKSFTDAINGMRRIWPLLLVAAAVSPTMRDAFRGFVWEEDGKMVGSANVLRQGTSDRWYIANVAVLPEYRRRGIARRLVEACMDLARERKGRSCWTGRGERACSEPVERLGFEHFSGRAYLTLGGETVCGRAPEGARLEVGSIFDRAALCAGAAHHLQHVRRYEPVEGELAISRSAPAGAGAASDRVTIKALPYGCRRRMSASGCLARAPGPAA